MLLDNLAVELRSVVSIELLFLELGGFKQLLRVLAAADEGEQKKGAEQDRKAHCCLFSAQPRHGFDMRGLGEHVDRLQLFQLQPLLLEHDQIAGEAVGVAADIDQSSRRELGKGVQDRLCTATAGRIDDHDPTRGEFGGQLFEEFAAVAGEEAAVVDPVRLGIALSTGDRFGVDFDTDDLFGMGCEVHGDAADAAVEIDDPTGTFLWQGPLSDQSVDPFGLRMIDLEKGARRQT